MIRVIGFGNTFHGDDGFGPAVARALLSRSWPNEVAITEGGAPGLAALSLFENCAAVLVVDALHDGGTPGEVGWVSVDEVTGLASDTLHGGGLAEMLRAMPFALSGKAPAVEVLLGRVGQVQPFLEGLSETISAAVPHAVALIEKRLATLMAKQTTELVSLE
jgi:hydrogenase maturation protease